MFSSSYINKITYWEHPPLKELHEIIEMFRDFHENSQQSYTPLYLLNSCLQYTTCQQTAISYAFINSKNPCKGWGHAQIQNISFFWTRYFNQFGQCLIDSQTESFLSAY